MSRLSAELLRRWDEDPDAGYRLRSPFSIWWKSTVEKSVAEGADDAYRKCVKALDHALFDTVHATQSDVNSTAAGLTYTMQAMELWRGCDPRLVPKDPQTFDLEDLDQAILLVAFQFSPKIGTPKWTSYIEGWFLNSIRTVEREIKLGVRSIEVIKGVVDEGEDKNLDELDNMHWVLAMLEWFKLEDPRRKIGLDLDLYRARVSQLERELKPVFPKLKQAGAIFPDRNAPKSFWWRH